MTNSGNAFPRPAPRVGYESPSQFNREFKRMFGRTPGEEAREMRISLTLSEAMRLDGVEVAHRASPSFDKPFQHHKLCSSNKSPKSGWL